MERRTVTLEGDRGVVGFLQIPALLQLPAVIVWNHRAFMLLDEDTGAYYEYDCYHSNGDPITTTAPSGERGDAPEFGVVKGGKQ